VVEHIVDSEEIVVVDILLKAYLELRMKVDMCLIWEVGELFSEVDFVIYDLYGVVGYIQQPLYLLIFLAISIHFLIALPYLNREREPIF
jgi:hypothetical protein